MYSGEFNPTSKDIVDSITIRCLSIKERVRIVLRSVIFSGESTDLTVSQSSKDSQEKPSASEAPKQQQMQQQQQQQQLNGLMETTFAQQLLFDSKIKSVEERLGLTVERLFTSLTTNFKTKTDELQDRINVAAMGGVNRRLWRTSTSFWWRK